MLKEDYGRLYYSVSTNGLHWNLLNGGRRIFNDYRGHPDLCRGHDGRFYLIGNIIRNEDITLWVSTNLVTWSKLRDLRPDLSRVPDFKTTLRYHGAPKIYFDEGSRLYLVTWHTPSLPGDPKDPEAHWRSMRTLFMTSKDLVTFTEPRRFFSFDMATIDVIVRREDNRCFAIIKDEMYPSFDWPTGKSIRIAASDNLLGPYSLPSPRISPNFREAPTVIPRLDGPGWYLYSEQYPAVSYTLATAPKLDGPWHDVYWQDYSVPANARHGSMIPITRAEMDALLAAFGKSEP